MTQIWLWQPSNHPPEGPIREDQYKCACGLTAKFGFTVFTIFDIVLLVFSIIGLFIVPFLLAFQFPLAIGMIVLAVMSIKTLRPFFMQIYGIIYIIEMVYLFIALAAMFFLFVLTGFLLLFVKVQTSEERTNKNITVITSFVVAILSVLTAILALWRCKVSWEFYKYVRDRQLAIEKQPSNIGFNQVA
ncbi:unnamed protein product, partial [Mesorhabditis belari]|uniref:NADH dehydrogenase subunit 6 n=1 Tax=Mesorhabditis belari TaxID=2138241 RepID=A0A915G0V4_9BILA